MKKRQTWYCPKKGCPFFTEGKEKICPKCQTPLTRHRGTMYKPGKVLVSQTGARYIVQTDGSFRRSN